MREITVDEFMEKAASLKGNVEDAIAREVNEQNANQDNLREPPVVVALGKF